MKNLLVLIAVCLLIWGVVYEYREHRVEHVLSSGDTLSPDGSAPASGSPTNSDIAIAPIEQPQTLKQVIVPGSAPTPAPAPATPPPTQKISPIAPAPVAVQEPTVVKTPIADTIAPNPPNGTVFSGTGHFQIYRQGNLTWRINTDTGQSCILFATDAEWRKPRVYERGCPRS